MRDVFICDGVRTAIGRYGGSLSKVRTDDLASLPLKALQARNGQVDWARLDDVYFGCANQAGEDNRNVARMALLLAGLPPTTPGITLNRLCASGLDAVGMAARAISPANLNSASPAASKACRARRLFRRRQLKHFHAPSRCLTPPSAGALSMR